jgi:regulator of cell morphogenesis and NO signaling
MHIDPQSSIGSLAKNHPQIISLFDRWGLDYCCGGRMPLAKAVETINIPLNEALVILEREASQPWHTPNQSLDFASLSPGELVDSIENTHHAFTRQSLNTIEPLVEKVLRAHGQFHTELNEVYQLFHELKRDLEPHLLKEERVLFPMIRHMEKLETWDNLTTVPGPGSTQGPITCMHMEHDEVGSILKKLSSLTNNYTAPDHVCNSYKRLYAELKDLQLDLHQHIHLENNVLFPQVEELERRLRQ